MTILHAIMILCLAGDLSLAREIPVLGSMYSDTGAAAGGVRLATYPFRVPIASKHKRVKVYPVAVYTDKVTSWKYKVLKVRNPAKNKFIYVHVVDECSSSTSSCRSNKHKARASGKMLLDIHQRAWKALGIAESYGLHSLKASRVGKVTRKQIPKFLTSDGKKDYVPHLWK